MGPLQSCQHEAHMQAVVPFMLIAMAMQHGDLVLVSINSFYA